MHARMRVHILGAYMNAVLNPRIHKGRSFFHQDFSERHSNILLVSQCILQKNSFIKVFFRLQTNRPRMYQSVIKKTYFYTECYFIYTAHIYSEYRHFLEKSLSANANFSSIKLNERIRVRAYFIR
jgi:hypothetical protein